MFGVKWGGSGNQGRKEGFCTRHNLCGRERRPCRHSHWAVVISNKAGNFVLVKEQGRIAAVGTETKIVSIYQINSIELTACVSYYIHNKKGEQKGDPTYSLNVMDKRQVFSLSQLQEKRDRYAYKKQHLALCSHNKNSGISLHPSNSLNYYDHL